METLSFAEHVGTVVAAALDRKLSDLKVSRPLYNTTQAATYLNCSTCQVWRLRRAGRLPFVKTGGKPLYEKRALDNILNEKGAAL